MVRKNGLLLVGVSRPLLDHTDTLDEVDEVDEVDDGLTQADTGVDLDTTVDR